VIALDGVAKAYPTATGRKIVLEDATVEFAPGHNFGILGANGAGKSTLIRLLAGSESPTAERSVARPGCRFRSALAARSTAPQGACPSGRNGKLVDRYSLNRAPTNACNLPAP
jgi:ATPase subunit of ABC transporter with duplicated ATPase domains